MHTEHLQNVRPQFVALGWFVSVAVTSLIVLGMAALQLVDPEGAGGEGWVLLAIVVGFFLGGWFTGARVGLAPILHAVAIGLVSVVVWLIANVLGELANASSWNEGSPAFYAGGLLVQIVAAAVGARIGSRSLRAQAAPGS